MKKKSTGKAPKKKKAVVNYKTADEEPHSNILEEPAAIYITAGAGKSSAFLKYLGIQAVSQGASIIKSIHDFISIIRKGITRQSLDHLMHLTGITTEEMAAIMHTSDRTLRRYTSTTVLNPEQSERAIELARLYSRGEEVFGNLELFKDWMEKTVLALGNKKPKEFLDTSLGIDILMDELGRIEQGIFA